MLLLLLYGGSACFIIINWKASLHTFTGFCIAVIHLSPLILPHVHQLAVAKDDDAVTAHDDEDCGDVVVVIMALNNQSINLYTHPYQG